MKKIWLVSFCLSFAVCANAQSRAASEGGTAAMNENRQLQQQQMTQQIMAEREANNRQAQYAAALAQAQQAEMQKILSRDPWRRINGATNLCNAAGWYEFQGVVQEVLPNGVVFKGQWGPILTVNTYAINGTHLTTTSVSSSANAQNSQTTTGGSQNSTTYNQSRAANANGTLVTDTTYSSPKTYGNDIFFVENFPYPTPPLQGYEEMMAYESGYFSYTNSARQTITLHKLDYGTPCTKIWTAEELRAADPRTAANQKALKLNQQLADNGDVFGLLRMGERYREGDGVPKDLIKARDYLTKAAAAGSITAADELLKLNRVLTNSPTTN
jgi:TPR repeat protein